MKVFLLFAHKILEVERGEKFPNGHSILQEDFTGRD